MNHNTIGCVIRYLLHCGLITFICLGFAQPHYLLADEHYITQQVYYDNADVGEVTLVWGVDGWNHVPEEVRPPGTTIGNDVMQTPMLFADGRFVLTLQIPAFSTFDYGVYLTKDQAGAEIEPIWIESPEVQIVVLEDSALREQTANIQGQSDVAPAQSNSTQTQQPPAVREIRDFTSGLVLLAIAIGLLLLFFSAKWSLFLERRALFVEPFLKVAIISTVLYLFLLVVRSHVTDFTWLGGAGVSTEIATLLIAGYYDFLYVIGIALLFFLLLRIFGDDPQFQHLLCHIYVALAVVALLMAVVNLEVIQVAESFFSTPWHYPDIVNSLDARRAIVQNLSSTVLFNSGATSAAMLIVIFVIFEALKLWRRQNNDRPVLVGFGLSALAYFFIASVSLFLGNWNYAHAVHPVTDLVYSTVARPAAPSNVLANAQTGMQSADTQTADTQTTDTPPADTQTSDIQTTNTQSAEPQIADILAADTSAAETQTSDTKAVDTQVTEAKSTDVQPTDTPPTDVQPAAVIAPAMLATKTSITLHTPAIQAPVVPLDAAETKIQNVIFFVLKAIPPAHLSVYSTSTSVMPNLNNYRQYSLNFRNIRTTPPTDDNFLVALVNAGFQALFEQELAADLDRGLLSIMGDVLQQNGYQTAAIQGADDFVEQQTPTVCEAQELTAAETAAWGSILPRCMVPLFNVWLGGHAAAPFFAQIQTGKPPEPDIEINGEIDFGLENKELNRQLNALRKSDAILGDLLKSLDDRGLLASTLVVVMGDSGPDGVGSAANRTQNAESSLVTRQNPPRPLFFINPTRFSGNVNDTAGTPQDIAATIMDVLNLQSPQTWQGQNLLSSTNP